jgi:hypothetical protein
MSELSQTETHFESLADDTVTEALSVKQEVSIGRLA